jgi:type 1 glutamine amidotransferase
VTAIVLTGGHPFESEPFFAVFDEMEGVDWRHLAHPDAYAHLAATDLSDDVLVFYDMPGVEFTRSDPPMRATSPPDEVVELFERMTRDGVPMVFLHHAIASWPAWPAFAEMLGGRFHYAPGSFMGQDWPGSGYRHDVTHTMEVLDPDHPVCVGLGGHFTITDELYLFPVDEAAVMPLMRSAATFADTEFFSADLAIRGERGSRDGWAHPPGSDLVAWTTTAGASTIVYLQFGDGPQAYADPAYRRALRNAITWAARRPTTPDSP